MVDHIIEEGKITLKKQKKKEEKSDLEKLVIYGKYLDLLSYTEKILQKYPKCERFSLASKIKNVTYEGMECIIYASKYYEKAKKLDALNLLDVKLKMIKVLVRISYKAKYISLQNYRAWSNKLFQLGNLLGGWINSCLKV